MFLTLHTKLSLLIVFLHDFSIIASSPHLHLICTIPRLQTNSTSAHLRFSATATRASGIDCQMKQVELCLVLHHLTWHLNTLLLILLVTWTLKCSTVLDVPWYTDVLQWWWWRRRQGWWWCWNCHVNDMYRAAAVGDSRGSVWQSCSTRCHIHSGFWVGNFHRPSWIWEDRAAA